MYGPWFEPDLLNGAAQAPSGKKRFAVRQGVEGVGFKGVLDLAACSSPVVVCTLDPQFLPDPNDTDNDLFATIITDDSGSTFQVAMVEIDFASGDVTVTWPAS